MTSEVRFTIKYRVPPQIIFEAITNEEMISKYTQAKAKFEKKKCGIEHFDPIPHPSFRIFKITLPANAQTRSYQFC